MPFVDLLLVALTTLMLMFHFGNAFLAEEHHEKIWSAVTFVTLTSLALKIVGKMS